MDIKKILEICDHTLLLQPATWEEIKVICDDAKKYHTASICIPPCYVKPAKEYLNGKVKICTVIGFPNGNMTTDSKVFETKDALEKGADEIDMVINIGMLRAKEYDYVLNESEIKKSDEEQKKIIVEMAEFLNSFSFAKLFRLNDNDFALVYDNGQREMNEIESAVNLDVIRQRFKSKWGENSILNTKFLYIPDGHIVSSAEEFIEVYERNRYKFDKGEDMRTLDETAGQDIKEYRTMVLEIKDALRTDRVEVFYQPIYSVETGKFVSAEALARIRGNDGKLIMPGRFIPVAEESGLVGEIGERVFSKTCRCIKENNLKMKGIDYVEVNLSVSQCENPMLSSTYNEIMRLEEVRPKEINLEITESSTLNQRNILLENMRQLMNMGCGFSLDDFGTGESNLNYIVDMPVNIVKFDRSMVQDYFTNKRAEIVMRATVGMIKDLGLKIVAEGVETEEQVEGIKKLGIDYIQGYYYSKPLSKSDFIRFIETKNAS